MWTFWLIAVLVVYMIQVAVVLLMEHRRPAQLTAWLLIVLVCPGIGFIAYLILGKDYVRRRAIEHYKEHMLQYANQLSNKVVSSEQLGNEQMKKQDKLFQMLTGLVRFPITSNNKAVILTNGRETYEAILDQIERAKHHIHMDYYTIRHDEIGMRFLKVLTSKARSGIEVRVLYDGIGSLQLDKAFVEELRRSGVQTSCFLPPRLAVFDRKLNYRNHRKIVVVDGKVGFLGGINIGDEYLGKDPKLGFWRDTHLQLQGDSVSYIQEVFMNDWAFASKQKLSGSQYLAKQFDLGDERVLIVPSKPGQHNHQIVEVMFAAITAACSRIYITTPYFIPDPSLLMALRTAALGGIDVRLIIPGIADSKLVLWATLSYMQEMLDAGVKVYRYEKGFTHAKVMIVDHMLATVGTANVDMRSLLSNFELNAVLFDEGTIARLEADFIEDLKQSRELNRESFVQRPTRQKLAEAILHILSPLL
ncbi:cardiolipin synthase [Paenibacillus sinopodophylli]|uniref:cardiolipin synthase n=1 Tax=Paenibacillus sinopodophylli TaxID=1837342 RepID=UPI00110C8D6E|nr:cardiolipin synthase [Paenibacillus sinopodophylli]